VAREVSMGHVGPHHFGRHAGSDQLRGFVAVGALEALVDGDCGGDVRVGIALVTLTIFAIIFSNSHCREKLLALRIFEVIDLHTIALYNSVVANTASRHHGISAVKGVTGVHTGVGALGAGCVAAHIPRDEASVLIAV
jgi:hypothetical protein